MEIEFDPAKDVANLEKHGESLHAAAGLDWEAGLFAPDYRRDYGEERWVGYVTKGGRLYCVVFVDRGDVRRIISLRKANRRESRRYARDIHGTHPPHS
ncbi:MAG: BrnT family toxin [Magnetococcales bacterium]|nr:BrnT family toxin [Magnetococcales bacterium]